VGQPHAATRSVLKVSVVRRVFESLASGIALRAGVRLLVFVAGATGVSKISSMSVGLGSEILRFPLVALLQRLARIRPSHKNEFCAPAVQTTSAIAKQPSRRSASSWAALDFTPTAA